MSDSDAAISASVSDELLGKKLYLSSCMTAWSDIRVAQLPYETTADPTLGVGAVLLFDSEQAVIDAGYQVLMVVDTRQGQE